MFSASPYALHTFRAATHAGTNTIATVPRKRCSCCNEPRAQLGGKLLDLGRSRKQWCCAVCVAARPPANHQPHLCRSIACM